MLPTNDIFINGKNPKLQNIVFIKNASVQQQKFFMTVICYKTPTGKTLFSIIA